jgi:chondroitin AC lyase
MRKIGWKIFKKREKKDLSSKEKKIRILAVFLIITVCGVGVSMYCGELNALSYFANEEEKADFTKLALIYEQGLWGVSNRSIAEDLTTKLVVSSDGYYFNDVNYNDDSRASWQTVKHIQRLREMINNYGKDLIASNKSVNAYVIGTLDYWLTNDFKCPNWWYNEIYTPQILADIGLMLKNYLSEERIGKMKTIIERGVLCYCHKTLDWTGANLLDAVDTTIAYSFFSESPYFLKKAVAFTEDEIFVSDGDTEGIKNDYTFYQHGAQQAIVSYGLVYVYLITHFAHFLDGTSFQISNEKMGILVDFILSGQRYAIRGNNSNYLTNGRSFSRKNGNNAITIRNSAETLISLKNCPKKDKLKEFSNSFENFSFSLNETKYFPYAHTLFDISPDYYIAVKGAYNGFTNSERVNSENILGRNLGYGGVTTYQYTGNEYNNISALWDFSKLPGTTAYNESDEELENYSENNPYRSSTTHSDACADGKIGALYVDIENEDGLYCRQAYITYNGLMVCLGNSLSNTKVNNIKEVCTTINQVYAKKPIYKGSDIDEARVITDNSAIENGEFAYYNLEGNNLIAEVANVTGNLKRNNLAQDQEYSGNIFKLYYNYGANPNNQSFAYAVLANPENNFPPNADGLPIIKITNNKDVQAVEFIGGTAVIIFHKAGSFSTVSGEVISASTSSVRILK